MSEKDRVSRIIGVIALVVAMVAVALGVMAALPGAEEPVARSYGCAVYTEQGCAKYVVASGGEIEVQSGGVLDIQSGATSGWDAAVDLDSTLNVDGAVTLNSTLDVDGNISSGTGTITATDNVMVDGAADAVQLQVQGYTTQTSDIFVVEQSDGTDVLAMDTAAITATGNLDLSGTFNYGAGDLTPLAYDSTTQYEVYVSSSSSVTQTTIQSDTHSMTTAVDWGICFVSDPDEDAGDPFLCTISISGTDITFQAVQDDGDNATTAATKIYYMIVGR